MLTKVILDGPMGKKFGREWELAVNSPTEALALIEANSPGLISWISNNAETYANYRVTVTGINDRQEDLSETDWALCREAKVIRFTPLVQGASNTLKIFIGVALIVASFFFPPAYAAYAPYAAALGANLTLSGIIAALSPTPKKDQQEQGAQSYYFNGASNTGQQGSPVPLIYGRVLVGAQAISAQLTVDQLMPI